MSFTFKNSVNKPVTARLETDRYINDNLAILVFETEPDEYDDGYYCNLTTNFGEVLESPDMFYLDTNMAPADLINVLEKDGLFTYTGRRPSQKLRRLRFLNNYIRYRSRLRLSQSHLRCPSAD